METHILDQIAGQQALSTKEFWRAFLVVFNHYLIWELGLFLAYPEGRRPPQEVIEAVQILGCWRDIAYTEDWPGYREQSQ